jgi:hypothetical protein
VDFTGFKRFLPRKVEGRDFGLFWQISIQESALWGLTSDGLGGFLAGSVRILANSATTDSLPSSRCERFSALPNRVAALVLGFAAAGAAVLHFPNAPAVLLNFRAYARSGGETRHGLDRARV